MRRVWLDGSHSFQYDQRVTGHDLVKAFDKLVAWKAKEGYSLAPYQTGARPPRGAWKPIPGGRFWWEGPLDALVIGKVLKTAIGDAAPRLTTGEEHLKETGGKIAFRVGSWFIVREHLAELPVRMRP